MPATWEPSFNFYLSELEHHALSVVVDLNAQTLPTHPQRLQLRVGLLEPRNDGLRDSSELEPMGKVEDQIVDRLGQACDAIYVGRYVTQGATVFVLYLPADSKAAECLSQIGSLAPYQAQWSVDRDPSWSFFHTFLYPNPYAFQSMMSRSLVEQLEQGGDSLTTARPVDHLAMFELKANAERASSELLRKGFQPEPLAKHESGRWSLAFRREESLAGLNADAFVGEVLNVILPLDGHYDGWGCPLIRN